MTAAPLLDLTGHPIIAHRGASGTAPENTIAAFDRARDLGVDGFELDIRLSADGLAVVHHDATLDRTTDGSGPLAHRSLAELERVDAGARFTTDGREFPFRARGVGIPTLRQVLDRYPDTPLLIELKVPEAAPVVRDELLRAGAANRAVVASFLAEAVTLFHQPPFLAGASRRDIVSLFWRALVGLPVDRGARLYAVPVRYRGRLPVPTRRFVAAARRLGRPVHVWTVDDVATAERLWNNGCAGMISNHPELLLPARNRRFGAPTG